MTLPFYIYADRPGPRLYELGDGRFQIIEQGELSPFFAGHDYLLVETGLADFLGEINVERVTIRDAIVWDRTRDVEYTGYRRVLINHHFSCDQIQDLNTDGLQMLVMGMQYPFVSPQLKQRLESAHFPYLCFSEGLTGFA